MTTHTHAAIRFEKVNYSARGVHILKNITGIFPTGKITTLVGPSGAGKTTLFKLCNGLKSPDSGKIYVQGKNINLYDPVKLRQTVGLSLQDATMIHGSVKSNLALPLTIRGKQLHQKKAKELMNVVGLNEDFLRYHTNDLSGGQRQKLSIARTLVNKPEILMLDEITSSLDPISTEEIEKLIVRINQNYGTTIIWITHSLEQARTIGHYTWVMMDGKVVESGETSLLNAPKTEEVKHFIKGVER